MVKQKSCTKKLFRRYMNEVDIETFKELSRASGIDYQTLNSHVKDPGMFRVCEIRRLDEILHFSDDDLLILIRG